MNIAAAGCGWAFNDAQLLGYGNFWDAVRGEKALASDAISKGLAEGREEEKKNIARNLKSLGLPIGQIIQAAGLTEGKISLLEN